MGEVLPGPFEEVARLRPVALVGSEVEVGAVGAPYVGVRAPLAGRPHELVLASGEQVLTAWWDGTRAGLRTTTGGRTSTHRSRRHGRPRGGVPVELALTLTGPVLCAHTRDAAGAWTTRARVDLRTRCDVHDEGWLAALVAEGGPRARSGLFGQVGLRDVRVVSHADGTPVREDGRLLLSATSAGPGFFPTAHTSLWSLDPHDLRLQHRSDLFFRRPDRPGAYGDHATHVVRLADRWLVATSTWGDFDPREDGARVAVTLAESTADLTRSHHVLDTRALALPTDGFTSVGVWDPHLVHTGQEWVVAYVSAHRWFRFHPVLATGTDLSALRQRAWLDRRATEGVTVLRLDGGWRVAASDGREGRRGQRARYPVLDLDLVEVGALDAAYPTNLPWPTLARERGDAHDPGRWLALGFDGSRWGGDLVGYGSHGALVVQRSTG